MATLDFTPLFRSSIGFDHVTGLLSHALQREESGYPPYNIEKVGEDQYRIVMAVAGFAKDDVEIVQEQNRLSVRGRLKEANGKTYLHRGIATRAFERHFDLADYVEVTDATMGEGLLVIDLKRELPEALKPRSIPINAGTFVPLGRKVSGTTGENARPQIAA
jgi:molecular chaperone IbpA